MSPHKTQEGRPVNKEKLAGSDRGQLAREDDEQDKKPRPVRVRYRSDEEERALVRKLLTDEARDGLAGLPADGSTEVGVPRPPVEGRGPQGGRADHSAEQARRGAELRAWRWKREPSYDQTSRRLERSA